MAGPNNNSRDPVSDDVNRQMANLDIVDQQTSTDEQTTRTYNVLAENVSISTGHHHNLSGTLADETLKLRISDAMKTFTVTESYKQVRRKLDQFGHVTICGASGEGKTTMALMLATDFKKKGYQVVFVDRVDVFRFNDFIKSAHRMLLIVDDIFGTVGLSTETTHLTKLINSIKTHIDDTKQRSVKSRSAQKSATISREDPKEQQKDIRVVFTSKTYNFKDGMMKLHLQRMSMFTGHTVVDLTTDKDYCYSDDEKLAIFAKHKLMHPTDGGENLSEKNIVDLNTPLFGFPLTCRLFFEFAVFRGNAKDFFKRPLFYLRIELSNLMGQYNNQTAALILMLLCEDGLDLSRLELPGKDQAMDEMFKHVTEIVPSATRTGVVTAARNFRGTFFSGSGTLRFAHSSITDAWACVLFQFNPSFVLQNCSYDFLYERLKPGSAEEAKVTDHLHFLFVPDNYHDLIAKRLVEGIVCGHFSKTVTHPLLKNEHFEQLLLERLQFAWASVHHSGTHWLKNKDKGKGILFWAVQGDSEKLVYEIANKLEMRLVQDGVREALDGCVEKDNLILLTFLLSKLDKPNHHSTFQELLLLSGKSGSWKIAQHLLRGEVVLNASDKNTQNFIHITCKYGKYFLLQSIISHIGPLVTRQDYLSALNSIDVDGRTPAMLAALYGSWDCFKLISGDSRLDDHDRNGDCAIHLACQGGNSDIVQHVLTPSNINSRGKHVWTPVMVAAVNGQQSVFDFLVSKNADLTLVDDHGDSVLHLACHGGNTDIVQHVLTSNINSRGRHGWTPVMMAAVSGQQSVFDFLVSKNADLTLVDDYGDSVLHLACKGGNRDIVQHVLTPSNINSRGEHGWTPVMMAAVSGQQSVFDFLVSKNADLTLVDDYGDSVLHLACKGGNRDIVQHVLTPSNINSRGDHGWTPVMKAAVNGQQSVFDLLVSKNADLTLVSKSGDSVLHLACKGGNRDIVQHVLTPSNINSRGQHGWTPVMKAAVNGQQSVFDLLVSKYADLTLVDDYGDSILHLACQGGNRDIVQHVLTPSSINSRGQHGWTPVMKAAVNGQQSVFDFLVSKNADLTLVSKSGDSVLHLACRGGNRDIVQHVLTPSNINSRGQHGWTPVMKAALNGQQSVFDFLVSKNADLTLVDVGGDSILHLACQGCNRDIVQHVLTPSNINSRGDHGWTPVMMAAVNGQQSVFDFLVSKNADLTLVSKSGDSVLHLACQGGNRDIVQHVLTPSNINSRGQYGWTPVMIAAVNGQQSVFDFLVSKNADLTLVDDYGDSILHLACQGGNRDIVQHVLTPSSINSRGDHGWTPVMMAAVNGQQSVFDFLVSKNADLTLVDVGGDSVLHLACKAGNRDIVQHVLTPSNINSRGLHGWTPVMKAAVNGQQSVFDFLVSKNADLTLVDDYGDSVLHLACQGGHRDIVQHVLTPSNINSRGQHGLTSVMMAAYCGHRNIIDLLMENQADLSLVDRHGRGVIVYAQDGGKSDIAEYLNTILGIPRN